MENINAVIESESLKNLLEKNPDASLKVIDATYVMPGSGYDPHLHFRNRRIGNAVFFDIDEIADQKSDLPHMLPSIAEFEKAVSELGISSTDHIIVYDQFGMAMAAARVWWMFRVFGHDKVSILNGGLPAWQAAGYVFNNTAPPEKPASGKFKAVFRSGLVADSQHIRDRLNDSRMTIIDARSAERFAGAAAEPRAGMRAGHIPGSLNIPFADLLDSRGRLKPTSDLKTFFTNISYDNSVVASCGSGVTACIPTLALFLLGKEDVAVYDGSWSDWGRENQDLPVARIS